MKELSVTTKESYLLILSFCVTQQKHPREVLSNEINHIASASPSDNKLAPRDSLLVLLLEQISSN